MDSSDSLHLVLDAGHIAVESALANQKEVADIQSKRGQALEGEDYVKLQSLMYDRFSLRLESTQVSFHVQMTVKRKLIAYLC